MKARALASIIVPLMLATAAVAAGDFALDDQFGRTHRRVDVFKDGPVVILAGSQRKTPEAMQAWERALRSRLPEGARVFGLSNLKRIPFFVPKGAVRKNLAELLPNTAVLFDWKGKLYPALGFPAEAVIAAGAFSASGERLGIVTGEVSDGRVEDVLGLVSP